MPISKRECLLELNTDTELYWMVVCGSLVLTSLNVMLYAVCFRNKFQGAPGLASQFFYSTGSMKVVMGMLIAFLFFPRCPDRCSPEVCAAADHPSIFYTQICTLIGLLWIQRGYTFSKKAAILENGESQGGADTMFQQVCTVEEVELSQELSKDGTHTQTRS